MSINHPNSIWTEAIIATVRKGWESGMSGGAIAALIHSTHGVVVSRNAVLGKVSRLRLSCRKTASRKSYPKRDRPTANHRVVFAPPMLDVVPVPPDDAVTAKSVHISDLEPHHCRWVMGEPRQTMFCGCEQVPGLPYCAGHAQRAYQPTRVHHHDRLRELVDA